MYRSRPGLRAGAKPAAPPPALSHNFTNGSLPGGFTFTRASVGSYVNASGLIASATANTPRYDYTSVSPSARGLLIEPQRTNLLLQSEAFDNAGWTKTGCTITANNGTAPDNATTADKLVENTAAGPHSVGVSASFTTANVYAFSCFVKAAGRTEVQLVLPATAFTSAISATFDLNNGTVLGSSGSPVAKITPFANGWYRVAIHATTTATAAGIVTIQPTVAQSPTYTGNGTSGLLIWGAQLELGVGTTSYIATTTAQVTRSADVLSAATAGLSWWNANEYTILCDCDSVATDGSAGRYSYHIDDGTANNRVCGLVSAGQYRAEAKSASAVVSSLLRTMSSVTNFTTVDAYKVNDFASYSPALGGTIYTDTAGAMPVGVTTFRIGMLTSGGQLNGCIKRLKCWNTRLANADLVRAL